jgi:hypothetical protein
MAATVIINRLTGTSPGSKTDITSINSRVVANDIHSVAGTINPVAIPDTGLNYSFWATTRLEVTGGLVGTIDNLRWYPTGSLSTGVTLIGEAATSYVEASGVVGTSGDELTTISHPGLNGAPGDLTLFNSGSPKSIAGSITATTGDVGDRMIYQWAVGPTAQPGQTSSFTFTWKYDET